MATTELVRGLKRVGQGVQFVQRGGSTGEAVVTMAHGASYEPVLSGSVMAACNAVAGVAPGTALSTAPPFALWNPPSSGINLCIMKISMGYVSGTLGAGTVLYGAIPSQTTVPTTGTEIVPSCMLIGAPRGVGRVFTGSTWTAAMTPLHPGFSTGAFLATTAIQPFDVTSLLDAGIVVTPGSGFALQAVAAAGTTPLVIFGITWEEIPVV